MRDSGSSRANHSGRSHPAGAPNTAPAAANASCSAERRTPRPALACRYGQCIAKTSPTASVTRAVRNGSVPAARSKRAMSMSQRSMGASPSATHCAITRPAPAEDIMPVELNPAATKKPSRNGDSPRRGSVSGVKLSGPFMKCRIPARSRAGTRSSPARMKGSNCSQSSGSSRKALAPSGPCGSQGLAFGSKPPSTSFPASSLR